MNDIRSRIIQCSTKPVDYTSADLGLVYIRRLTLGELDVMQKENKKAAETATDPNAPAPLPLTARLLSRFLGDETGKPIFDPSKEEDLKALLDFPVGIAADLLRQGNIVNSMEDPKGKD